MKHWVFGLICAIFFSPSFAATGTLISCDTGIRDKIPVFIGKYEVDGRQVIQVFPRSRNRYCPAQIEI